MISLPDRFSVETLTLRVVLLNVLRDVRVVRATAAHEDLVNVLTWGVTAVMVHDGLGADAGDRGDDVVGSAGPAPVSG
jgi:hypothetical protein